MYNNKRIKVLVFDPISRGGGGAAYLLNAIPFFLKSEAVAFHFFCNRAMKPILESKLIQSNIMYTSELSAKWWIVGLIERYFFSKRILKKISPDIVIFMNQISFKTKIPSLLFLRNALYYPAKRQDYAVPLTLYLKLHCIFYRALTRTYINKATGLIFSSHAFSKIVCDYYGHSKNYFIAPFGLNDVRSKEQVHRFSEKSTLLLFLQYNIYKGLDIAVHAMQILKAKQYPVKLLVTDDITGHTDYVAREIKHFIAMNNLQNSVSMVGHKTQDELKEIYKKSDIFLFPSYVESFGQGLIEAMANGLPCIASDLAVFKEIAEDSICYCKVGDPVTLAEQVVRLIDDPAFRNGLVNKSLKKSEAYSWESHVSIMENNLRKMAS
jgi:glycosyltransferase involved in cell wall biosynthesis